jgi:hypothetical protein
MMMPGRILLVVMCLSAQHGLIVLNLGSNAANIYFWVIDTFSLPFLVRYGGDLLTYLPV